MVALAASGPATKQREQEKVYLIICLEGEFYGLPGNYVREITRWRKPTLVPGAPPALLGILNQRGVVLPVVDARLLLGFPEKPVVRESRYIIIQFEDAELALLVDNVRDLSDLSDLPLEPLPAGLEAGRARFLFAIVRLNNEPVALLDLGVIIKALRTGA